MRLDEINNREQRERGKNIEPSLDPRDVAISEKAGKEEPITRL